MKMSLAEADDRVWTLHCCYIQVLENSVFTNLPMKCPHICISHIMDRVKPECLKYRMCNIIRWKKVEKFDQKDFGAFMRELAKQAKKLKEEYSSSGQHNSDDESFFSENGGKFERRKRKKQRKTKKRAKEKGEESSSKENSQKGAQRDVSDDKQTKNSRDRRKKSKKGTCRRV